MFDPELFVPLAMILGAFGVVIVSMLVKHQQRMTELVRGHHSTGDERVLAELRELRHEMSEMKQRMGAMMLQLDAKPAVGAATPPELPDVAERLNG